MAVCHHENESNIYMVTFFIGHIYNLILEDSFVYLCHCLVNSVVNYDVVHCIMGNLSLVVKKKKQFFLHMRKQRRRSAADQRLCFRYTDSTIPLLPYSEISSL